MFEKKEIDELNEKYPPDMDDPKFEELKKEIVDTMNRLSYLQRIHYREAGIHYKPFI